MEPLGNLNKVLLCAPRVAYPLMHHMHAQVCTRTAISYFNFSFFLNPYQDHDLYQGVAPPGLTYLTYRWRARQGRKKTSHKRGWAVLGMKGLLGITARVGIGRLFRLPRVFVSPATK